MTQQSQDVYRLIDYRSKELGIEFRYPATLGLTTDKFVQNKKLAGIQFKNKQGILDVQLVPTTYATIQPCDQAAADDCKYLTVNNQQIVLRTITNNEASTTKVFQIPTKLGVWEFQATDSLYYQDLFNTVSTLKFNF